MHLPQLADRAFRRGGSVRITLVAASWLNAAVRIGAAGLVVGLLLVATGTAHASANTTAWVDTGGDCLRFRTAPGLSSGDLACLDHGAEILLLGPEEAHDGFQWLQVQHGSQVGWVAGFYVTTDPSEVQVIEYDLPADTGFVVPPSGGITMGRAGVTSLAMLAASQPFEVASIAVFDIGTQQWRLFSPSAPSFANSITSVSPDDVVTIRRAGAPASAGPIPEASLTVAGTPNVLPTPAIGAVTVGLAGTTDPRFLVQAQSFTASSVWYFEISSQRWLTYTPGLPDHVQTLKQGHLRLSSVVFVRRGADAPVVPSSADSTYFETSITYYFCVPGSDPRSHGDGGGYCGTMANGMQVQEGVAACKPGLLGQRFRIEGDPTQRTYICGDTGGSVLQDHRDIWFMNSDDGYQWWIGVGPRAFIEILE